MNFVKITCLKTHKITYYDCESCNISFIYENDKLCHTEYSISFEDKEYSFFLNFEEGTTLLFYNRNTQYYTFNYLLKLNPTNLLDKLRLHLTFL